MIIAKAYDKASGKEKEKKTYLACKENLKRD